MLDLIDSGQTIERQNFNIFNYENLKTLLLLLIKIRSVFILQIYLTPRRPLRKKPVFRRFQGEGVEFF